MDQFQSEQDDSANFDETYGFDGTFTLAQLAGLLDVSRRRVRAWVTAGLIDPVSEIHGVRYFDFSQVANARTLSDLANAGIGTERVQRGLEKLRRFLPDESPDQLALVEKFGRLLVRLESGLAEPSGQMYFDFGDDVPILETRPATAEEWFQLGCQHEEDGAHEEAINAYRQSLLMGGPDADACFNLANALYAVGQKKEASERYRQVVEIDHHYGEAWNNMGVVLGDLQQFEEAHYALGKAIQLGFVDARTNLTHLLDREGRHRIVNQPS